MRIGIDARMIYSSGIGTVIENLLRRIIFERKDWEFILIGNVVDLKKFSFGTLNNVEIIECSAPIYSLREQLDFLKVIPSNLDVLWVPHYNIPVFYFGKMVVTVHDLAHLALPEISSNFLKKSYAELLFRIISIKAKKIVCVSKFTINEFKSYVPSLNLNKVELIYNGVDKKWFDIPFRKKIYSKPFFLYVGNIKPHKNLRRLILAYKKIMNIVDADLILIGKKDGFITGENNIADLTIGCEDRIIFTGFLPDLDLHQFVSQAKALVFPSLYEGFGLPPLEAMAAGCPVLTSRKASIPEVCGDAVLYCDVENISDIAEKMQMILSLNIDKKKMVEQASSFDWDKSSAKLMDIFEEVGN